MARSRCSVARAQVRDPLRTLAYGTDASFYRLIPKLVVQVEREDEVPSLSPLTPRPRPRPIIGVGMSLPPSYHRHAHPSAAQVVKALGLAERHGAPITFRAAGTSLSGQAITDSVLLRLVPS